MKLNLIILITALIVSSCKKEGCTDSTATNYDSEAGKNDGSCLYEPNKVYIQSVVASPTTDEKVTIKNNSGATVDLQGWIIGDSNNPNAYTISSGNVVATGNAIYFNASTMGFQINDSGETTYLKDASGATIDTWNN